MLKHLAILLLITIIYLTRNVQPYKENRFFWGTYCHVKENVRYCENFNYGQAENESIELNYGESKQISEFDNIYFRKCNLPSMPINYFQAFPRVVNVTIKSCELKRLDLNTLKPKTPNLLISINFSENKLESIPSGLFTYTTSLTHLALAQNKLSAIESGTFVGLNKLISLNLSKNNIKDINENAFQFMSNLTYLDLNSNFLTELNENLFKKTKNLSEINLSNNHLVHFSGILNELKKLESLDLSDNLINSIDSECFKNNPNLLKLNLRNNLISILDLNTFQQQNSLNFLDLSDNQLKALSTNHFKNSLSLFELYLQKNRLESFESDELFEGFERLEILNISQNPNHDSLKLNINLNLLKLTSIRTLNLSNINLGELKFNTFYHMHSLETLDLSGNKLNKFQLYTLYPLKHLRSLYLDRNQLTNFDYKDGIIMKKLRNIGISENNWNCTYLIEMVKYFHEHSIHCIPPWYHIPTSEQNIAGIGCSSGKSETDTNVEFQIDFNESNEITDYDDKPKCNTDQLSKTGKLSSNAEDPADGNTRNMSVTIANLTDLKSILSFLTVLIVGLLILIVLVSLYVFVTWKKLLLVRRFNNNTSGESNPFCEFTS